MRLTSGDATWMRPGLRARTDLVGNPSRHFVNQDDENLALKRLGVEQFVVAKRNRVLGQHRQPIPIKRHLDPGRLDDFD